MENSIGLVLAGGGAKGAYQIGVWRALREYGLEKHIKYIAGTSIGALNSLLFVQGNLELAEAVWHHVSLSDLFYIDDIHAIINRLMPIPSLHLSKPAIRNFFMRHLYFSRKGLAKIIDNYVDFTKINTQQIYVTCTDVTDYPPALREPLAFMSSLLGKHMGIERDFLLNAYTKQEIKKIVLASSALPFLYNTESIDGRIYYDGGLINHTPIDVLYKKNLPYLIVVQLDQTHNIDHSRYPQSQIIEIIPQEYLGGTFKGTLNFTTNGIKQKIAQGYHDAKILLKPLSVTGLTIESIDEIRQTVTQNKIAMKKQRRLVLMEREKIKLELIKVGAHLQHRRSLSMKRRKLILLSQKLKPKQKKPQR